MTMVSVMKKITLFMMVLALAVSLAACQGAVGPVGEDGARGPKGEKGDPGADGSDGTPGPPGMDAFQPLSLKADSPFIVISDTTDADDETVPGAEQTIDIADYMRGSGERTYGTPANSQTTAADQIFEASLEGSMLTITPKDPQPSTQYSVETFSIMVSDGGESQPVTLMVKARRNRSPAGPDSDATATVGTQAPDEAPEQVRECTANDGAGADKCYVDVTFTDEDSTITDGEEKLSFVATSSDTSKVEVVSVAPVSGTPLAARLVVRGVASTWDKTIDTPAHDPVEVVIVATDAGDEMGRGKAQITVDGAPILKETIPGGSVSQGDGNTYVIQDVSGFFEDPEGETLTFTAESGNTNAATVVVSTNTVTVTRNAPGTAMITVTATEPSATDPEQTAKGTFTVTVR